MLVKDEKEAKPDLFKPQAPQIPGVVPAAQKGPEIIPETNKAPKRAPFHVPPHLIVGLAIVFSALAIGGAWLRHNLSARPAEPTAVADPFPEAQQRPTALQPSLPKGPGPIASTEELANTWSAKKFLFTDPVTGLSAPAMVVHIPGGYWGFSLEEPFGKCELEYVRDPAVLRQKYSVITDHAMIVDPCNNSVFDLMKYGEAPRGLVRGDVIQGPAIRPPIAIEVKVEGDRVIAVRGE